MTTFIWPYDGNQVSLAGTFNNWVPQPMKRDNEVGFTLSLPLENGIYQYKFVIDGRRWCYDLLNPSTTDDRGNRNNVIEVGPQKQKTGHPQGKGGPTQEKGRTGPPPKVQERKSEKEEVPSPQPQHPPPTKGGKGVPQERKSEREEGDGDGVDGDREPTTGGGKKQQQQQHQKQQQQQKQQQKSQKQQQPKVSAVAKTQSTNLIKTVKSYGVPFYVGDVDCDNSTEDVISTAQLFQKALPEVGCMLISGGVEKLIVVAVVPESKTSDITAVEWVNTALSVVPGYVGTGSDTFAQGEIPANPDAGIFPIKLKDLCRGPTFVLLRAKGLVKEEESEDEMYFFDE